MSSSSSSTKKTKCVDVVNPLSGGKRALELYNVVKDEGNVDVMELIITVGQMDAHDRLLAMPNLLSECALLRVFGGDGLMNECVNAIAKLVGDDWSRAANLRFQIHRCGSSNAVHKHITDSLAAQGNPPNGIVWLDVMRIDAKNGDWSRHAALHSGMALMADFDVLHEQKMRNVPVWAKDFLSPAMYDSFSDRKRRNHTRSHQNRIPNRHFYPLLVQFFNAILVI